MADWTAGLDDLDDQGLGPSAANPLTAAGLDPDMVRANPDLLASLSGFPSSDAPPAKATPQAPPPPSASPAPAPADQG